MDDRALDHDVGQSAIIRKAYGVGDVAQLGERRTRTAEVVGSTPIVSTSFSGFSKFLLSQD